MDKDTFFRHYPKRKEDSHKYENGHILLIGGSYGMAGALIFNILGARSAGASYIEVLLPDSIYPIVASREIAAVYHPGKDLSGLNSLKKVKAISIGSGMTNDPDKETRLQDVLERTKQPLVIDAEGLRIYAEHPEWGGMRKDVILTPHLGEFSVLTGYPLKEIKEDKVTIAVNYAKEKDVILILKGPKTLIVSPDERVTINDSGNEALARAGSGDILTGMVTALCALYHDPYQAAVDAVWLHGHLADEAVKEHSKEVFDLTEYPHYADRFFFER